MVNFKYGFSTLLIVLVLVQILHAQEPEQHGKGSSLDAQLGKKYILVNSDRINFLKIMQVLGVSVFTRIVAVLAMPEIELTKLGDQYTFSCRWVFTNEAQTFKPGVPFAHVTPDGRNVTSTITIEGPTLHEVQKEENGRMAFIDRTFSDKQVKTVIKVGKLVATRIYSVEHLTGNKAIKAKIQNLFRD